MVVRLSLLLPGRPPAERGLVRVLGLLQLGPPPGDQEEQDNGVRGDQEERVDGDGEVGNVARRGEQRRHLRLAVPVEPRLHDGRCGARLPGPRSQAGQSERWGAKHVHGLEQAIRIERRFRSRSLRAARILQPVGAAHALHPPTIRLRQGDKAAVAEALNTIADEKADASKRQQLVTIFGTINQPSCVPALLKMARSVLTVCT